MADPRHLQADTDQEHEGASRQEILIEACRRNNVDLLREVLDTCKSEAEISDLLNNTRTVLGNHLYHEAALQGNYEIIDALLDQPNFECDPLNRADGDTPLHSAVRWINSEPPQQRAFGNSLVDMMLEAGSNPRARNRAGLTAAQLADPANSGLRELMARHEYALLNAGDFISAGGPPSSAAPPAPGSRNLGAPPPPPPPKDYGGEGDSDAEFSGSDEEERAEWERRRREKQKKGKKGR